MGGEGQKIGPAPYNILNLKFEVFYLAKNVYIWDCD